MGQQCCSNRKQEENDIILDTPANQQEGPITISWTSQKKPIVKSKSNKEWNDDNKTQNKGQNDSPKKKVAKFTDSPFPYFFNQITQAKFDSLILFDWYEMNGVPDYDYPVLGPYEFKKDNSVYLGQWYNGKREGRGKISYQNGSFYEGSWENDQKNGKGRQIYADGDVYEGDWVDNKAEGFGVLTHLDETKYSGSWNKGMQAKGKENFEDGEYEGEYVNGKWEGKGEFRFKDGSNYIGDFKENYLDGSGVYNWVDGRSYNGQFELNKMHGRGTFTWQDGRKYEGLYQNDLKHGFGIMKQGDKQYKGYFQDGKKHGYAEISNQNEVKTGLWENGKRIKWLSKEEAAKMEFIEPWLYNSENQESKKLSDLFVIQEESKPQEDYDQKNVVKLLEYS